MYRQYFMTDLDGTLLRSDATLSDFTVDVMNQALGEGHIFSFATARSFISAKPIVKSVGWCYPIIIYNGALIIDPKSERILHGNLLPNETTTRILHLGHQFGLVPFVFGIESTGTQRVWHEAFTNDGQRRFVESRPGDPRFQLRESLFLGHSEQVIMLTYIASEAALYSFKHRLNQIFAGQIHVHFTRDTYLRDYYFLEISHPLANKEEALKEWTSLVGCAPGDVTVFGDNLNDLGLFREARKRIAVANAHKELKLIADEVIGTNDHDGVARYIQEVLKLK